MRITRHLKQVITVVLAVTMILATAAVSLPETAEASILGELGFNGASCTTNGYAASIIDYNILKYPYMTTYPGTGTCWGYAETIRKSLAAKSSTKYYTGLKPTEEKVIELLDGCKAGTHLRVGDQSSFQGNSGHSYVILSFDTKKNRVIWTDNNGLVGYNKVGYYTGTVSAFCYKVCGWGYINMITKVTDYKKPSTPLVNVGTFNDGIQICWTKTAGASKYIVYRSTSKTGTYSSIATVTTSGQYSYTDKKATAGKTYYYKVKAVKSGSSATSSVISCKARLMAPVTAMTSDIDAKTIKLTWKPVNGATSYVISRETEDIDFEYFFSTGNLNYITEKVKTTTSTSFTVKGLEPGDVAYYHIKSYSSTLKKSSDEAIVCVRYLAPDVKNAKVVKHKGGSETLSWDPIKAPEGSTVVYTVIRYFPGDGSYEAIGQTGDTKYDYTPTDKKDFQYGIQAAYQPRDNYRYIYSEGVYVQR